MTGCIHVVPVAQPRPRVVRRGGRSIAVSNPQDSPITLFKYSVQQRLQELHQEAPLEGCLHLSISFHLPRKRFPKKDGPLWQWHPKRPDLDNLTKAFKDAASGILWKDDSQVCRCMLAKLYCGEEEVPRVWFNVAPMDKHPGKALWYTPTELGN